MSKDMKLRLICQVGLIASAYLSIAFVSWDLAWPEQLKVIEWPFRLIILVIAVGISILFQATLDEL